jgi:two-component system NtrC family sensor kinase
MTDPMVLNVEHAISIYVIPPVLGFFVLIGLSLISILRGKKKPINILFAGICFLGALVNANVALVSILPDKTMALKIDRALYLFIVFAVPLFIQFVHSFLDIRGRKWIVYTAFVFSIVIVLFTNTELFISGFQQYRFGTIARAGPVFIIFAAIVFLTVVYCLYALLDGMRRATDNQQKNRIKYILGGMGVGSLLIALNILTVCGIGIYPMGNFSFIPAVFLAFGVLKYDLLDIGTVIRKGTVYFILTGILAVFYILIIYLFNASFMGSRYERSLVPSLVLAALIVLVFNPLRNRIQAIIDDLFFRGKYDYQSVLKDISGEMASLMKFEQIRNLILQSISTALMVTHIDLYVYDNEKRCFRKYSTKEGDANIIVYNLLEYDHPVVNLLEQTGKPLDRSFIDRRNAPQGQKDQITSFFRETGASLVVPMISQTSLVGMIALGQKKSGELFVHEDMELLMTIANQSVTALENAKSYEEIEKLNRDLEKKVEERTADLRQALDEKERTQKQLIQSESLAAIGQLVAGTAHELNNPLASASSLIQTSVESVSEWDVKVENRDEVINDLEFSVKELRRASDIVRSLLDLSRQTQVYVELVNINMALDDALRVLYNQYKNLNIEIEKDYDEDLPYVEGNFANLGQVFINVIKNAVESLPDDAGKIVLKTAYKRDKHRALVEICDNGEGIPDGHLQNIFKPFFTTKPVGKGTGLGLYISHEIVRRHGGDIGVTSEVGKGTTFSIELPCKENNE